MLRTRWLTILRSARYSTKSEDLFIPSILFDKRKAEPPFSSPQDPASASPPPKNSAASSSPYDVFEDLLKNTGNPQTQSHETQESQKITFDTSMDASPFKKSLLEDEDDVKHDDVKQERELFDKVFHKVFEKYNQADKFEFNKQTSLGMRSTLQDTMKNPKSKLDRQVTLAMRVTNRLKQDTIDAMFSEFSKAIKPTLDILSEMSTRQELSAFLSRILKRFQQKDYNKKEFALSMKKNETVANFSKRYVSLSEEAKKISELDGSNPMICAYTVPLVFNKVLQELLFRFHDAEFALTLFNLVKKDLSLYMVCCNQDTYNEMLRMIWVYYGKSSLAEVEMTFLEMKNNGFPGNVDTYRILREIILQYHMAKLGKGTGFSFWLKEDEKRVRNLEKSLSKLVGELRQLDYE